LLNRQRPHSIQPSDAANRFSTSNGTSPRPQWGPVTFDFGVFYYGRPGNKNQWFLGGAAPVLTFWTLGALPTTPLDQSFIEFFGKSTWAINDYLTLGSENYFTPNWAGYNADALYSGGNAKLTLPGSHASLSGAFGHYFLGMGDTTYGPTYIQPSVKGSPSDASTELAPVVWTAPRGF